MPTQVRTPSRRCGSTYSMQPCGSAMPKNCGETAVKEKKDTAPFDKQIKAFESQVADLKKREKRLDTGVNRERRPGCGDVGQRRRSYLDGDRLQARQVPRSPRLHSGQPGPSGELVPRRFVSALSTGDPRLFKDGSGRKELADAIVTDASALTARVFVNRVWGWVFGRGLVTTPSNFERARRPPNTPRTTRRLGRSICRQPLVD